MIDFLKKLIKNKETKVDTITPCELFEEKILNNIIVENDFSKENDHIKLSASKGDKVICPLGGLMVIDKDTNTVSIDHGHYYISNRIRRVITDYGNLTDISYTYDNNALNRILLCRRIEKGEVIGKVGEIDGDSFLKFQLFLDYEGVDPEPFLRESYK